MTVIPMPVSPVPPFLGVRHLLFTLPARAHLLRDVARGAYVVPVRDTSRSTVWVRHPVPPLPPGTVIHILVDEVVVAEMLKEIPVDTDTARSLTVPNDMVVEVDKPGVLVPSQVFGPIRLSHEVSVAEPTQRLPRQMAPEVVVLDMLTPDIHLVFAETPVAATIADEFARYEATPVG